LIYDRLYDILDQYQKKFANSQVRHNTVVCLYEWTRRIDVVRNFGIAMRILILPDALTYRSLTDCAKYQNDIIKNLQRAENFKIAVRLYGSTETSKHRLKEFE